MIHAEAQQLVAGAALEDLAPEEWREYQAHRRTCVECGRLEVELDNVLADLALAVPERIPPANLFAGIRRAIAHGEGIDGVDAQNDRIDAPTHGATPVPAPPAPRAHVAAPAVIPFVPRPARTPLWAAMGMAAVLSVVAVGLGAQSSSLSGDLAAATAELASLRTEVNYQSAMMAVAFDPGHVTAALRAEPVAPEATAYVVYVPGTDDAWLVAHGLPATPAGKGYQLWFADAAGAHPLGTYSFNGDGAFVAPFSVDLASSSAAMVTLEPASGATGEPGPQVVFGELAS